MYYPSKSGSRPIPPMAVTGLKLDQQHQSVKFCVESIIMNDSQRAQLWTLFTRRCMQENARDPEHLTVSSFMK